MPAAWIPLLSLAFLLRAWSAAAAPPEPPVLNGFKLAPASVPTREILAGGPPRDGIPALTHPRWLPASEAPWHDAEIVVGVVQGEQARAYPIAILNWHELVNDTLGGRHILVSYCPLCGTALVFDREADGRARTFGVSGLLYQSDLLLYDRESESLWSQIASTAIVGPAMGERLRVLRSALLSWGDWKARHPRTQVLSLDTGHQRPYARDPYAGYSTSDTLIFPAPLDQRYHPKMPTLGVRLATGAARAYPAQEVQRAGGLVQESFEGRSVQVSYQAESKTFDVEAPLELEVIEGYWFAWAAFHPGTTVFVAEPMPAPPAEDRAAPLNPARYRLAGSGSQWETVGEDRILEDLRPRYSPFFDAVFNRSADHELDLRPLRDDLELKPVDRHNYDALNAIAIAYFELNARAESDRGGSSYLADSFRSAKLVAVPWRAYIEVESGPLRDAILDFFEDIARGEKQGSAATAARLERTVSSLEKKESDPERLGRIHSISETLQRLSSNR